MIHWTFSLLLGLSIVQAIKLQNKNKKRLFSQDIIQIYKNTMSYWINITRNVSIWRWKKTHKDNLKKSLQSLKKLLKEIKKPNLLQKIDSLDYHF